MIGRALAAVLVLGCAPEVTGPTREAGSARNDAAADGVADSGFWDLASAAAAFCPRAPAPCRIMPLGDSMTWIPDGYRVAQFRLALADRKDITFVGSTRNGPAAVEGRPYPGQHEGHPGFRIDQLDALLVAALDQHQPHVVQLMAGTNDAAQNVAPETAGARYGALLDRIFDRAPGTLVIASTIPPMALANAAVNARVAPVNAAIAAVIAVRARAGRNVVALDMHAAFLANPRYASDFLIDDGVHPSAKGCAVIGDQFHRALAPHLP